MLVLPVMETGKIMAAIGIFNGIQFIEARLASRR